VRFSPVLPWPVSRSRTGLDAGGNRRRDSARRVASDVMHYSKPDSYLSEGAGSAQPGMYAARSHRPRPGCSRRTETIAGSPLASLLASYSRNSCDAVEKQGVAHRRLDWARLVAGNSFDSAPGLGTHFWDTGCLLQRKGGGDDER
jgi:hypothetical protein